MGGLEGPPIPPNVRSAPAKPWRSSINATWTWGASKGPLPPKRSERPGQAVALLYQRHNYQRHDGHYTTGQG